MAKPQTNRGRIDPDDPQKGQWGGSAESNGRKLSGSVKSEDGEWYRVTLSVTPTKEARQLRGNVVFHLHDTFIPQERVVAVSGGKAVLTFYAWGAFTVGAEADDGKTRLELDLAEVPTAPKAFRER